MNCSISAMPKIFDTADFVSVSRVIAAVAPSITSPRILVKFVRRAVCLVVSTNFFAFSKLLIRDVFAEGPVLNLPLMADSKRAILASTNTKAASISSLKVLLFPMMVLGAAIWSWQRVMSAAVAVSSVAAMSYPAINAALLALRAINTFCASVIFSISERE